MKGTWLKEVCTLISFRSLLSENHHRQHQLQTTHRVTKVLMCIHELCFKALAHLNFFHGKLYECRRPSQPSITLGYDICVHYWTSCEEIID